MDFSAARMAMVDSQVRPNDVTKYSIIAALQKIERENFVPDALRSVAYAEVDIEFAEGRALLDPRIFSKLLDGLNITPSDFVLDIGCGLGYSCAVIGELCEAVVGVEYNEKLVIDATENLQTAGNMNAVVVEAQLKNGAKAHGPYDVIMIEGAVEEVPKALLKQLKDGGRIGLIQSGSGVGVARVGVKSGDTVSWRDLFNADAPILPGFETEPGFKFV